jgi:hypothetical protein
LYAATASVKLSYPKPSAAASRSTEIPAVDASITLSTASLIFKPEAIAAISRELISPDLIIFIKFIFYNIKN